MAYPTKDEVYAWAHNVGVPPIQGFGFAGTFGHLPTSLEELKAYTDQVFAWSNGTGWVSEHGFGYGQWAQPGPDKDPKNGLPTNIDAFMRYENIVVGNSGGRMNVYPPVSQGYPPGSVVTSTLDSTGPSSNPSASNQMQALAELRAALVKTLAPAPAHQGGSATGGSATGGSATGGSATGGSVTAVAGTGNPLISWGQKYPLFALGGLAGAYFLMKRR